MIIEITARYEGTCATCGDAVRRGEKVRYDPRKKKIYCVACSERQRKAERAEQSMERYGTDCAYDY